MLNIAINQTVKRLYSVYKTADEHTMIISVIDSLYLLKQILIFDINKLNVLIDERDKILDRIYDNKYMYATNMLFDACTAIYDYFNLPYRNWTISIKSCIVILLEIFQVYESELLPRTYIAIIGEHHINIDVRTLEDLEKVIDYSKKYAIYNL